MAGFTFGIPASQTSAKNETAPLSFGVTQPPSSTAPTFGFGSPATTFSSNTLGGLPFGSSFTTTVAGNPVSTVSQPAFGLSGFGSKSNTPSSLFNLGMTSTTSVTAPTFGTVVATSAPPFGSLAPTTSTNSQGILSTLGLGLTSKPSTVSSVSSATGLSFGAPTSTTAAPAGSGFALGLKPAPTTSTTTSRIAPSLFTLAGTQSTSVGLTLGTSAPSATAVATTSTGSLGLAAFGPLKAGTTTTTSGFSLSSFAKPSESTTAVTTTVPTTSVASSTATVTATTVATTITTAAGTSGTTLPSTASLTYRQLEDMVNKWTYELEEQSRNFSAELSRLNRADGVLIANSEKISDLHAKVEACKTGQSRIEQELEFVESQQRTLEDLLEPLEQAAADLPPSQQHADAEREAIFQMCINTDLELGQLLSELREMAERVNAVTADLESTTTTPSVDVGSGTTIGNRDEVSGFTEKSSNVIGQVTRILNSHMHSLSWLNQNTQELMEKMKFLNTA